MRFNADNAYQGQAHGRTLKELAPFLWPAGEIGLKARVVVAVVLLVAAKITNVGVPFIYSWVVDALNTDAGMAMAIPFGLIFSYGAARIGVQAFGDLRDAVFARVGQRALHRVALKVFEHLHALSLAFHLERRTGGLSRAIERGTKAISFMLRFTLFNVLPTLLEILIVTGVMWVKFSVWFALVTLVSIAGYIVFTFSVTEWRIKFRREMNTQDSTANTRAIDSLINYETVKYFGNERHESERFDQAMTRYENAAVKSESSLALLNIGQMAVVAIGQAIVMLMAAWQLRAGSITMGEFVLANTLLMQLYAPLGFLGFVYREIKQALVDMETMFSMTKVAPEVTDKPDAPDLVAAGGHIRFEDVSFHYEAKRPILKSISFDVPAGSTLAIVGPSGAGKSTISRLLFRFYDVTEGRIVIDGQDIREVTQDSLRRAIGIVPQDTVLFNDTIAYNIAYGNPNADREAVIRAAKVARIHEFIAALPEGYDTMVGERGLKLSGGEKQRVAIARTVLKDPPILVLDEATSALDSHTEAAIQEELKTVCSHRTALMIAHRLSTVVHADQILVLEDGEIVERGAHPDLLERGGVYAAMWRRQQEAASHARELEALSETDAEAQSRLSEVSGS